MNRSHACTYVKIAQLVIHFHRSTQNENLKFLNDDYLLYNFVYNNVFSFLNAFVISKEPVLYINRKIQYSTARTAEEKCLTSYGSYPSYEHTRKWTAD